MNKFNERNATSEELYNWCIKEYESTNLISKCLINRFYKSLDKIIEPILPDISNIIEIGCGAGESTLRLLKMVGDVKYEATEYDQRYIDAINNRNFPIQITKENVFQLKRRDNTYDCVIMLEVLEHLENINLALSELFRISSEYVIISVPNEPIWRIANFLRGKYIGRIGNTPGHINHFNKKKLKNLLAPYSSDITIVKSFPWIIILAKKL